MPGYYGLVLMEQLVARLLVAQCLASMLCCRSGVVSGLEGVN